MRKRIVVWSLAMIVGVSSVIGGGSMNGFGIVKGEVAKAVAAQEVDFNYVGLANGTIKITGYKGTATALTIPGTMNGKKVTQIGEKAFYKCSSISSVIVPEGVTEIGVKAFRSCYNLKSVILPKGLLAIRYDAFGVCDKLETIHLPEGMITIEEHAFYGCRSLRTLAIPEGITVFPQHLVQYCVKLEKISLPSSLAIIQDGAFCNCDSLKEIVIPEGVTAIGKGAFWRCKSLAFVQIPKSVTKIGETAFVESSDKVVIKCVEGSYAQTYGAKHEIPSMAGNKVLVLEKTKNLSLKSVKKHNINVKIGKVSLATGYQVVYSNNSKMTKPKTVSSKKTALVLKKMVSQKYYYVKARAYSNSGEAKVFGKYSTVKKIKVK